MVKTRPHMIGSVCFSAVLFAWPLSAFSQREGRVSPSGPWPDEAQTPGAPEQGSIAAGGTDVPLGGTRESCVAINPLSASNVVMSSLFQSRTTTNGGVSWTAAVSNIVPPGYGQDGDPTLAFDHQGRWFYGYQGRHSSGGADEFVSVMDPVTGARISGPVKVSTSGTTGAYNDKPWLAVDRYPSSPFVGRLYLVWTEFPNSGAPLVLTSYSSNQGATWSPPLEISTEMESFAWPSHVAVAPNGDVYISYHSQTGFFCNPDGVSGRVLVVRSTDGGVSFPQKTVAFASGLADITFNVQDCGSGLIAGAVFWTQGSAQAWVLPDPHVAGSVYVVSNDDPDNVHGSGDEADVFIARSADHGVTWDASIRVDHGPSTTFQVMPAAAIDDSTGCIAVIWYDNRNGAVNASGHYLLDVFYSISSDKGLTWSADVQLNSTAFNPDLGASVRFPGPPATLRIGEYIGVSFLEGTMHAVWTGNTGFSHQAITDSALDLCIEVPPAAIADATGINKVRHISLSVPPDETLPIRETALRVQLASLHHPDPPYSGGPVTDFTAFEGQYRWVGPPSQYIESTANPVEFSASVLQCTPHYQDWGSVDLLHVTGAEVVPSSIYQVQAIVQNFDVGAEGNFSDPLTLMTTRWGDLEIPFHPPSDTVQPDVSDIAALVNKFRSSPSAPIKARSLMVPAVPDELNDVGFGHISAVVDAFRGLGYPFTMADCP